MGRSFANPRAFKDALESRIKKRAQADGVAVNRLRQIVIFERLLARIYEAVGNAIVVKGGFVLELRLARSRTTKDIDLRVEGGLDDLIAKIIEASRKVGADYLRFDFSDERDFQEMLGDQVVYGGRRLQARARLGGVPYGDPFFLDMSVADRIVLPPDRVEGTDLMEFANIERLEHIVYPEEAHIAEKLHAYAMPRSGAVNSRTKDLVDIGLLARHARFDASDLTRSIEATFEFRGTNPLPPYLPDPPPEWTVRYGKLRDRDGLIWPDIEALFELCREFLNPVLGKNVDGAVWDPEKAQWENH